MALPVRHIGKPEPLSESCFNVCRDHGGLAEDQRSGFLECWRLGTFPWDVFTFVKGKKGRLYVTLSEANATAERLGKQQRMNEILAMMEGLVE